MKTPFLTRHHRRTGGLLRAGHRKMCVTRGGVREGRETAARYLSINGVSVVARPRTKNAAPRQGVQTIHILYGLGEINLSKCKWVLTESERDTAARTALRKSRGNRWARVRRSTVWGLEAIARNASGMLSNQLLLKTAPATDWKLRCQGAIGPFGGGRYAPNQS